MIAVLIHAKARSLQRIERRALRRQQRLSIAQCNKKVRVEDPAAAAPRYSAPACGWISRRGIARIGRRSQAPQPRALRSSSQRRSVASPPRRAPQNSPGNFAAFSASRAQLTPQRHRANSPHIRRHIFADAAVPMARQPAHQLPRSQHYCSASERPSIFNSQRYTRSFFVTEQLHRSAPVPLTGSSSFVVCIVERETSAGECATFLESIRRLNAPNALRRRVRRHRIARLRLQAPELVHQLVVLRVRDLRRVLHVIQMLVAAQLTSRNSSIRCPVFAARAILAPELYEGAPLRSPLPLLLLLSSS